MYTNTLLFFFSFSFSFFAEYFAKGGYEGKKEGPTEEKGGGEGGRLDPLKISKEGNYSKDRHPSPPAGQRLRGNSAIILALYAGRGILLAFRCC